MLNMVSAILQQEPPLSVNYTIIWGRGRLSAWLLWALSCFNISFCPNTFLQNETTKHWWKQNKTWNKLIWTLDTCVMGFIWFRGLNQILTTLALCVTIEASFTILRDIMGEDQLQRLSKIDSSESLLFQLEMEKKKKNPYFVVECYNTQKEWGCLVVMCPEQTSLFRMCLRCLGKYEEPWSPQRMFECQRGYLECSWL